MSEKTKEVPQLAGATYAHTLVIKSTTSYGQSMSIGCVSKFGYIFGFLRHYLLTILAIHGAKITKNIPPSYVLLDYFTTRPSFKICMTLF